MKVLFTANIPSPYRVAFFNELGRYCDLTVLFEKKTDNSRDIGWRHEDFRNFKAIFLPGWGYTDADAFCPSIRRYLKKGRYDVIVIGIYHSLTGMIAIDYLRHHHIHFILNSDGGQIRDDSGIKKKIKTHYISSASAWLSTGKMCDDYLIHYGAKREKIYRYPFSSVREEKILKAPVTDTEKGILRDKLGIPEEQVIISVGQFIFRKGYDVLIRADAELLSKGMGNIGIYVIGGNITEEYKKLMMEYNLNNIHFLPFMNQDDLAEYYKAADLFVLPTREDIWGLVINEAMAYGLPVITTDKCNAGLEMLTEKCGCIVESDSVDKLAGAIMTKNCYSSDEILIKARQYSIESMVRAHMDIFSCFAAE